MCGCSLQAVNKGGKSHREKGRWVGALLWKQKAEQRLQNPSGDRCFSGVVWMRSRNTLSDYYLDSYRLNKGSGEEEVSWEVLGNWGFLGRRGCGRKGRRWVFTILRPKHPSRPSIGDWGIRVRQQLLVGTTEWSITFSYVKGCLYFQMCGLPNLILWRSSLISKLQYLFKTFE